MTQGVWNDNIQDQFDQLFSSILLEQKKYNKISPPTESKKRIVEDLLEKFTANRGRGFFYNYLSSGRGHGPFTELLDDSVKYDLIGGIGPNLLGHSHPLTIKSHLESALTSTIMCGNLLPHKEAYSLTKEILSHVKKSKLKNFWFAGSGSFANDSALKMIWQKKTPAYKIIAFEHAFAGRSVATQDITYNKAYRDGMPSALQVDHVPHYDYNDPDNAIKKTISALDKLAKGGIKNYAAIMIELVQGEGGFIYGTKEYYEAIFKWAKQHNLYIWVDEVQTFGRTTELFSFQHFELDQYPDIVTVGKALQACGVLFSDELNPRPGLISGTFNGSISSLKAGKKILEYLINGNFYGPLGKTKSLEETFLNKLEKLSKTTCKNKLGYFTAIGTMVAFEVGQGDKETTVKFLRNLFKNGVIAFMAGQSPVKVRFLLPLCLQEEHIDEIFFIIEKTLHETIED